MYKGITHLLIYITLFIGIVFTSYGLIDIGAVKKITNINLNNVYYFGLAAALLIFVEILRKRFQIDYLNIGLWVIALLSILTGTAAFLLWLPKKVGAPKSNGFGLGQLSFSYKLNENISAFGSTFLTSGLPVSEFVRHIPFSKRFGIDFFRTFLDSCLVGNAFLPGFLSTTKVSVSVSGVLNVSGGVDKSVSSLMGKLENVLRKNYWKMGAVLLPGSFSLGSPGGDIHYSSTLPMRIRPKLGETNVNGELFGLNHVYVIDGACLTSLSEKSHTLTIMANADRIGRIVTNQIKDEKRNE